MKPYGLQPAKLSPQTVLRYGEDDSAPVEPFVSILAPADGADVYNYTAWVTSGSGPREARINAGPWVPLQSGLMSSFLLDFYTLSADAFVTLETRLISDTGITDSRTYTKKVPTAPARQDYELYFAGDTSIQANWVLPAGAISFTLEFWQEPGAIEERKLYWTPSIAGPEGDYAAAEPATRLIFNRNGVKDNTETTVLDVQTWHTLSADYTTGSLVTVKVDAQAGESLSVGVAELTQSLLIGGDGSPANLGWIGKLKNLQVDVAAMPIHGLRIDDNSNTLVDWAGGQPASLSIGSGAWLPIILTPEEGAYAFGSDVPTVNLATGAVDVRLFAQTYSTWRQHTNTETFEQIGNTP